ncbi:hypothetical protein DLM75_23840 [Leptospira stimsonii]|uniref:Uncharacterized protein n=1 Tax=Leptospira stimsonii TaxID=2202203 RepID=A0A396YKK4_9LEPT|nr:hypothetical protein DLM75_23840 [Leptospira stimsonii]
MGIKGILQSIKIKDILKDLGFLISIFIAFIFTFLFYCRELSEDYLSALIDMIINSYPSLLGFMVGGYALIVGFGNKELVKRLSESEKDGVDLFNSISSKYAYSILVIAFTLLFSWNLKIINYIIKSYKIVDICSPLKLIYFIELFIIFLLSSYSFIQVFYIVTNTYTFGIMNSIFIKNTSTKKNIKKKK